MNAAKLPTAVPTSDDSTGAETEIYTKSEVLRLLGHAVDWQAARTVMRREAKAGYVLVPAAEFLTVHTPPEYVIHGLIERGTSVGVVGPPESGKSLLMAHLLACVATGQPFHGRAARLGLAVWLCGEGQHGIARRLQALEAHYGCR